MMIENSPHNTSDQYKCIFVHIPKAAGTSVKEALGFSGGGHPGWQFYAQNHPRHWQEYYKFTVVRNPWDRVVSAFAYAKMEKSYWHNTRLGPHPDHELLRGKSFAEFCDVLQKNRQLLKHESWHPQFLWVAGKDGNQLKIMVDRVLRYENLAEEFSVLMADLGISDVGLPHVNKSERKSYRDYYDANTRQVIADIYAADIALFGYEF